MMDERTDQELESMALDYADIEDGIGTTIPVHRGCKVWSGAPSLKHAVVGVEPSAKDVLCQQSHSSLCSTIASSKTHTVPIYNRKAPPDATKPLEDDDQESSIRGGGVSPRHS